MRHTSLADLRTALESLAIPRNAVVMVHSSLFPFGVIEGGVEGVYDVLWGVLGGNTTLVMPAFTWDTTDWHYDKPSQVGALTEYHRQRGVRTVHPFHSVSVVGPFAGEFAKCDCLTSWGLGSPFTLLRDLDAYNLSVGALFVGGATFLHTVEEELQVPYRRFKPFPWKVYGPNGLDPRPFGSYARLIADQYEYVGNWDHVDLPCRSTTLNGAPLTVWHIPTALDVLRKRILADPFYVARVIHKGD